jgi:hypothetical protein
MVRKRSPKKYDGQTWYWPHDYRHYLRDASSKQRKAVHKGWLKIGVPVKKDRGRSVLSPRLNQKEKSWNIIIKEIAPTERLYKYYSDHETYPKYGLTKRKTRKR